LGAVTVIATYSRGGFVGLLVLGVLLLKGNKHKIRTIVLLAVAAAALYAIMPDDYVGRIDTIKTADADNSFMTRVVSWKINLLIALDHPFFGGGPYASLNWGVWMTYLPASTTLFFPTMFYGNRTLVAHSIYFQALGDTGFVGFFLFFGMIGTAVLYCSRIQRIAKKNPELAWAGDLARAMQVSFLVYCVAGAALSLNYFELVYILIAMISRLHQTVREQTAPAWARVPARAAAPASLVPAYPRVM
jgi:putative inorganic carbon (HCO3(-)) transporter